MNHTPGPWHLHNAEYGKYGIEPNQWGRLIHVEDETNEADSNARLIAAAPELLKALEHVVSTYRTFRGVPESEQMWTSTDDAALEEGFAAIAKAKGE